MVLRNGYLQFIFALLSLVGLFAYTSLSVYFMFTPMRGSTSCFHFLFLCWKENIFILYKLRRSRNIFSRSGKYLWWFEKLRRKLRILSTGGLFRFLFFRSEYTWKMGRENSGSFTLMVFYRFSPNLYLK